MKRREIIDAMVAVWRDDCDEENFIAEVKDIIDHFEGKFNDIRDLLNIESLSELEKIYEAHQIANSVSDDLY